MVDVPIERLAEAADAVVRGKVLRTGSRVKIGEGLMEPRTHVWIRVEEVIAGEPRAGDVVHVWEPGGRYEGVETVVAGAPHYEVGEEVVVFLVHDDAQPGLYRTLEMTQGKYHILEEAQQGQTMAVRDLSDVSIVRWKKRKMQVVHAPAQAPVSVDSLRARVRALRLGAAAGNKEATR